MTATVDTLTPGRGRALRSVFNPAHVREDLGYLLRGVLDFKSFASGYLPHQNTVESTFRHKDGSIYQIVRSHNLRVTMGRDNWQRLLMFGDITANATGYTGVTGTASSAPSATTLTNSGAAFPTSGGVNGSLQGHMIVCPVAGVYCIIVSNTATVVTVDQWTNMASATGAAGTTPSSGAVYAILPHAGPAQWMGLSTNSAAAAAGDVVRTADGLFGDGTTSAAATEQNANGLAPMFVQPTFPGAGQIQLVGLFTYTGSTQVSVSKAILKNSKPSAGSLLVLETLLSATGTFNASGDNLTNTWVANL